MTWCKSAFCAAFWARGLRMPHLLACGKTVTQSLTPATRESRRIFRLEAFSDLSFTIILFWRNNFQVRTPVMGPMSVGISGILFWASGTWHAYTTPFFASSASWTRLNSGWSGSTSSQRRYWETSSKCGLLTPIRTTPVFSLSSTTSFQKNLEYFIFSIDYFSFTKKIGKSTLLIVNFAVIWIFARSLATWFVV